MGDKIFNADLAILVQLDWGCVAAKPLGRLRIGNGHAAKVEGLHVLLNPDAIEFNRAVDRLQ